MSGALHSKATPRWGTDEDTLERGRRVMGWYDLDPCTEAAFEAVVRAGKNYSLLDRGENALELPWFGKVMCNPPGGLVREFWRRAMTQPIDQMIWVGFSVEQLCLLADEDPGPLDFSYCILRHRIGFKRHDGYKGSPSHGNYVSGVFVDHDKFKAEFSSVGKVKLGRFTRRGGQRVELVGSCG